MSKYIVGDFGKKSDSLTYLIYHENILIKKFDMETICTILYNSNLSQCQRVHVLNL